MTVLARRLRLALGVLLVTLVGACSSNAVAPTLADIGLVDVGTVSASLDSQDAGPLPAGELRLALEQLLGHHATLTAEVLRGNVDGTEGVQAAADALADNTTSLRGAVALAYGDVGGTAFANLWVQHVRSFAAYAAGLGTHDRSMQDTAVDELADYERDFATFTSVATGERLPADAVQGLLEVHVADLTGQAALWADGDPVQAISQTSAAYAHMATIADALALAIADQNPERFPGDTVTDVIDQRSALGRALAQLVTLRAQTDRQVVLADADPGNDRIAEQVAALRAALGDAAQQASTALDQVEFALATPTAQITEIIDHVAAADTLGAVQTGAPDADLVALLSAQHDAWREGDLDTAYALTGQAVGAAFALTTVLPE